MNTKYNIINMIYKVSQSYNHIIYNNNYTRDYFIVDYIWCNEGENTYIKLIDNPLKFNIYSLFKTNINDIYNYIYIL